MWSIHSYLRRYLIEMIRPTLECGTHIVCVPRFIICTRNTLLVTGLVIENGLDVPGLYAKFGHASCSGPAQVMQAPVCNGQTLIKLLLSAAKDIEATLAKEELRGVAMRLTRQDSEGLRREW